MDLRKFVIEEQKRRTRLAEEVLSSDADEPKRKRLREREQLEMDEEAEYFYCLSASLTILSQEKMRKRRAADLIRDRLCFLFSFHVQLHVWLTSICIWTLVHKHHFETLFLAKSSLTFYPTSYLHWRLIYNVSTWQVLAIDQSDTSRRANELYFNTTRPLFTYLYCLLNMSTRCFTRSTRFARHSVNSTNVNV